MSKTQDKGTEESEYEMRGRKIIEGKKRREIEERIQELLKKMRNTRGRRAQRKEGRNKERKR